MKILTGVLVHRVTRPLRGSVSCGSGWSVPCVSIQLTLSQNIFGKLVFLKKLACVWTNREPQNARRDRRPKRGAWNGRQANYAVVETS